MARIPRRSVKAAATYGDVTYQGWRFAMHQDWRKPGTCSKGGGRERKEPSEEGGERQVLQQEKSGDIRYLKRITAEPIKKKIAAKGTGAKNGPPNIIPL